MTATSEMCFCVGITFCGSSVCTIFSNYLFSKAQYSHSSSHMNVARYSLSSVSLQSLPSVCMQIYWGIWNDAKHQLKVEATDFRLLLLLAFNHHFVVSSNDASIHTTWITCQASPNGQEVIIFRAFVGWLLNWGGKLMNWNWIERGSIAGIDESLFHPPLCCLWSKDNTSLQTWITLAKSKCESEMGLWVPKCIFDSDFRNVLFPP